MSREELTTRFAELIQTARAAGLSVADITAAAVDGLDVAAGWLAEDQASQAGKEARK